MKHWILTGCFLFSALGLFASDLKNKGEVDIFAGGIHTDDSPALNKGIFGFSGGYGVASMVQLFGEYSYVPIGENVSGKAQLYTGGVKVNVAKSDKADPYLLLGFGGLHFSADCSGCSENDKTLHVGGGVRIYAKNKKWGVVPEVRWIRIFSNGDSSNVISYTGGVFFQWGK